ncbi:AHH domain-containing protein [Escherichia coli]|uniref:AHH domain-containing protein n=1 Tax=Escherichia coli TaxID=562 RepID=UPI003D15E238
MDPLGLSCSSDAKKLSGNLGAAPSSHYRPHHMVMSNSSDVRMRWLRRRMDRLGININDSKNGVWLPKNSDYRLPGTKLLLMVVKVYMEMHINNMCGIR